MINHDSSFFFNKCLSRRSKLDLCISSIAALSSEVLSLLKLQQTQLAALPKSGLLAEGPTQSSKAFPVTPGDVASNEPHGSKQPDLRLSRSAAECKAASRREGGKEASGAPWIQSATKRPRLEDMFSVLQPAATSGGFKLADIIVQPVTQAAPPPAVPAKADKTSDPLTRPPATGSAAATPWISKQCSGRGVKAQSSGKTATVAGLLSVAPSSETGRPPHNLSPALAAPMGSEHGAASGKRNRSNNDEPADESDSDLARKIAARMQRHKAKRFKSVTQH